jgi:hypothetical protein
MRNDEIRYFQILDNIISLSKNVNNYKPQKATWMGGVAYSGNRDVLSSKIVELSNHVFSINLDPNNNVKV